MFTSWGMWVVENLLAAVPTPRRSESGSMGVLDGILGTTQTSTSSSSSSSPSKWLKTREMWLVVLGVILHAVYMLSIFDIYFKTPIVHGLDPVRPRFSGPAKRLVLLVGRPSISCSQTVCLLASMKCCNGLLLILLNFFVCFKLTLAAGLVG